MTKAHRSLSAKRLDTLAQLDRLTRSAAITAAKARGDTWTVWTKEDGREVVSGEPQVIALVKAFAEEFAGLAGRKGFQTPQDAPRRARLAMALARINREAAWRRAGGDGIDWKAWL